MLTVHQVYLRLLPFGIKNGESRELWVQPRFPEIGDYKTQGYELWIKADTRKRELVVTCYTLDRYPIGGGDSKVLASLQNIRRFKIDQVGDKLLENYFGDAELICKRLLEAQKKAYNYKGSTVI